MTDEQIAHARRAVACKGWRWMSGMATDEGHRVVLVDTDVVWMVYEGEGKCKPGCVEDFLPDLTDPATVGCLLALVREAWIAPTVYARPTKTTWIVMRGSGKGFGKVSGAGSEAEALVLALEGAP